MKRKDSKVIYTTPPTIGKHLFFRVRNQFIHISSIKLVRHVTPSVGADGVKREYIIKLDNSLVDEDKWATIWASKDEANGLIEWLEREAT